MRLLYVEELIPLGTWARAMIELRPRGLQSTGRRLFGTILAVMRISAQSNQYGA
jgi:hypothetical protein